MFMSQEDIQQKLDKVKDVLLHNKQLTDEDLEDVFAGYGTKDMAYLRARKRVGARFPWQ